MDIVYIIGIVFGLLVLVFGGRYLLKRYNIKSNDLVENIDIAKTIVLLMKTTAKDMRFGNDKEIDELADIILDSLEYIKTLPDEVSKEFKISESILHVYDLCGAFNLELNEDRKYIIDVLIKFGFNLIEALENKDSIKNTT